jgi:hypothetical protein
MHIAELAKVYIFRGAGMTVVDVCNHNADAAMETGARETAHTWRIIAELWSSRKAQRKGHHKPSGTPSSSARPSEESESGVGSSRAVPDAELAAEIEGLMVGDLSLDASYEFVRDAVSTNASSVRSMQLRDDVTSERHALVSSDEGEADDDIMTSNMSPADASAVIREPARTPLRLLVDEPEEWDLSEVVTEIMEFYGEHCDVQMCVTMMLVLGEAAAANISISQQLGWFHA